MRKNRWQVWVMVLGLGLSLSALISGLTPALASPTQVISLASFDPSPALAAVSSESYGAWDAMTILLREGLEALLVVAALLAFLNKSGHADQQGWIWAGALGGIIASIATAVLIRAAFVPALGQFDPELIEGITGLTAAGLLVYVSYWLHRQSAIGDWQRYIREQAADAMATNRLLSLALIAFLAIYREGAETVLFYIGIAPSISPNSLMIGLGAGAGLLVLIALVIIGLGVRIPLKPFFAGTSLLIYGLGFKLIGNAIHAFQKAGVLPLHTLTVNLNFKWLGIYPTWETLIPQLVLAILAAAVLLAPRLTRSPQS